MHDFNWRDNKCIYIFFWGGYIIQIMPGLEGDLEEWQTQEVNVTRGEAEGDIDLEGLPFLKVTRGPRHYLFCYSRQFYFFMHILIFTISI